MACWTRQMAAAGKRCVPKASAVELNPAPETT